ncbi:MAG: ATP-binding protein, partial [Coleofasciculus sp. S288]|nr:ATP-binding protein [Coleofasciculus sp. S288]
MVETRRPDNVVAYNERSLNALDRAIAFSQGEFSLVLVRCNYELLQQQMVHRLQELADGRYQIRELVLPKSVKTLFTTIQTYRHCQEDAGTRGRGDAGMRGRGDAGMRGRGDAGTRGRGDVGNVSEKLPPSPSLPFSLSSHQPHPALFIFGLDSVVALNDLFASTNQVRDEFRKRLPFPIVLWMNDKVLQKLVRFAPDFASWAATPIKFEFDTKDLLNFLRQKTAIVFDTFLRQDGTREVAHNISGYHSFLNLTAGSRNRLELDCALQDLQSRGVSLNPELDASLEFVFGLDDYVSDRIDAAIHHYQYSLRFWRQTNNLERQGLVLFQLGLCYCRYADQHRAERYRNWEEAWPYLHQCIEILTEAKRPDLVAQFVTQLAEVLQRLGAWSSLANLAQDAIILHQTYGTQVQQAQDYGFLAEVALRYSNWNNASQLAQKALFTLAESGEEHYHGLHRFLLAQLYQLFLVKAQRQLGHQIEALNYLETASQELEKAIKSSDHRYETQHYLHLLEALQTLYFEQGRYLEAFRIKQEQRVIEQLYGFRAFIGAGRLQPQRPVVKGEYSGSRDVPPERLYAQEIAASGRQRDVNRLIERISRADHKLTVIHGQSGVGKSSIVSAGLMPALKHRAIGDRIALPIVLQVYTDWVRDLGRALTRTLEDFGLRDDEEPIVLGFNDAQTPQEKIQKLREQLRHNAEHNLLTVLIFDQFEEFLFASTNQSQKLLFYEFLRDCLNLGFVKVILSIREDYLHFLLELEQFVQL